ncbi:unnamed protein product, partial [Rodentolepis nana]|uniref:CKK domain-containing protein n=1 Tax=Rodentolepis nana TaxID=102285 RepID=A0A0R3T189_RODNA
KRRREGTNSEEPTSLAEEEESDLSSNKFNDEFTVSQSDIPPEGSVKEGEVIVPEEEVQEEEALNSSSPVAVDVEGTDMDDFSSSVPEQVETSSNMESGEFPIQCSSPPAMSQSPPVEDIPTPRVQRRPSASSTSSPSLPSDELEAEEERRSFSRRSSGKKGYSNHHHSRHREDYDQLTSSQYRSESRCSQCSHCTSQSYYDSLPRRRPHGSNSRAYEGDGDDYADYYGTLPPRRVTKPPKAVRQPTRSVKNYRMRGRDYSPEGPENEEDDFVDETSSEVHWRTHAGRRRAPLNQRHHQRHLDAVDSGEEFSYPAAGSTLPPRPHRLELNHLGKSAGTGLDALVIAELARSVTSLRSDIERLTAQQLFLRSDLHEAEFPRSVTSAHSSSRLHLACTPSGSTRAMWSSRTPLRYPSQCDVQEKMNNEPEIDREEGTDERVLTPSPDHVTNENEPPVETSLIEEIKQVDTASPPDYKPFEEVPTIPAESPTPEPEIKPAETLFITFENPSSERLQRARERLEARRAADRSKHSESAIRARIADREAQVMAEISAMARNTPSVPADSNVFSDIVSENSGFPVHTTNGEDGMLSNGEGSSNNPLKLNRPGSARTRQTSAATRKTSTGVSQRPSAVGAGTGGGGSGRVSRSSSLTRSTARGSVTSSSGARPTTGNRVTSTNGRRETTSTTRRRSASRPSAGQLSNGPSLSSLHRLENGEESTYSGPGLPIAGNYPQPKLFVKPKSKSNRQVIVNAISHCCLAGTVNEPAKKLALQELAAVDGSHFIVLFRDNRCQYRALYAFDFDTEELKFICGNGPRKITHSMCDKFFKYNSGAKQFSEITSTKHLSAVVDAITIQNSWWVRNPPLHSNAARSAAASAASNVSTAAVVTDSSKS